MVGQGPIKIRTSYLITGLVVLFTLANIAIAGQPTIQPQGLDYSGIYQLRQIDPNLTGTGVKIGIVCRSITYIDGVPRNDYRPADNHDCFQNARFIFHDQNYAPPGISPHSTAICSILFGRDPDAYSEQLGSFSYEGAAPDAQAEVFEFWYFLINNVFAFSVPEVNVLTADIGYQFEDWWTRGIDAMAQQYGLTTVVGIGNGSGASDPVLYPGAGSNVIGVGVVKSVNTSDPATGLSRFALVYPEYSSKGPTSDGRCKPDIVAPGNCLAAVAGEPNIYEPSGTWSSFATPIVTGTVSLLVQQASADPNLQPAVSREGGNCVIKAILLNSANKLPYWHKGLLTRDDDHDVPLDYAQGAGVVNAIEAHKELLAGSHLPGDCPEAGWNLNKLNRDLAPANVYKITIVEPADKIITATVVWNKYFANTFPFEHQKEKDADIRLEVWAVDSNDPNNDYMLDFSDSGNDNLEHIYFPADANFTEYEIVVAFSNDLDANQPEESPPYGLCWDVSPKPARDNSLWLDLNANGVVDDTDINVLLDNILASIETPDHYLFGDINSDGIIDVNDLQLLIGYIDNNLNAAQIID